MKKILVVEDDQFVRELYIDVLKGEGYQVAQAVDGEEGLREMEKGGYDLVLLDVILPKIDGFEILKKLKKAGQLKKNKSIFLLTNLSEESVREKLGQIKIQGVLTKSALTPDQLVAKVKAGLK